MKFVQTLYIDTYQDPYHSGFGWARPEFHMMSWALSCLQLEKIYGNICLYANEQGAKLLIEELQLPYSRVEIFPKKYKLQHTQLWALPKLWTYSLQNEAFIHIDGDVYLFDKLPDQMLTADICGQNIEVATDYYLEMQEAIQRNFQYIPPIVLKDFNSPNPIHAINAGILGGNDIALFKEYTTEAFKYINNNISCFNKINVDHFNVFFEQHLLYILSKKKNASMSFIYDDIINDRGYSYVGNIFEAPKIRKYIHLLGHFKRDKFTCIQMANKLRELYPLYYNRIIELFDKRNIRIDWISNGGHKTLKVNFNNLDTYYGQIELSNKSESNSIQPDMTKLKEEIECHVTKYSTELIQQRDTDYITNYESIFFSQSNNTKIKTSEYCKIIETEFDWGGLVNFNERVGVEYYENWQFTKGHFYNLLIPEISATGFSLYDIEDIDMLILIELQNETSLKNLYSKMKRYINEDISNDNLQTYYNLIDKSIKRLALYKAIVCIF